MEGSCSKSEGMIALDWGTTNVRLALLAPSGDVIDERRGSSGVGSFSKSRFESHFEELTAGWPLVPALAAGMVGSRQGWQEVPYLTCPASPNDLVNGLMTFTHRNRPITIVPGLQVLEDNRADVMRGEESQISGFLTLEPGFTGTLLLPGTHSKWVSIENGTVLDFKTYMTGEIFQAISQHTILQHSLAEGDPDPNLFEEIACRLAQNNASIGGQLFGLRARHLLNGTDRSELHHELSALLILSEIRSGQTDGFDLCQNVNLIGSEGLTGLYKLVLQALGKPSTCIRGTALVWPALHSLAIRAGLVRGIKS